jgi:hypothetical protein
MALDKPSDEHSIDFMSKEVSGENPSTTLPGTVQKIIKSPDPRAPDKAQIGVEGADELYKEIRIDNALTDKDGVEVELKPGAQVEVTIEAEPKDTIKK